MSVRRVKLGLLLVCLLDYTHGLSASDCANDGNSACNTEIATQVFSKCIVCHSLEKDRHGVGPSLSGLADRAAGSVEGFKFSKALRTSGIVWDQQSLDGFLLEPQKAIPRNRMPFAGLKDDEERKALVCFLLEIKDCKQ